MKIFKAQNIFPTRLWVYYLNCKKIVDEKIKTNVFRNDPGKFLRNSHRRSDPSLSSCCRQAVRDAATTANCDQSNNKDVLSVKTLANMFDFKSNPIASHLKQGCAKLEDSRLFQKARLRCGGEGGVPGPRRNTTTGHNLFITTSALAKVSADSDC